MGEISKILKQYCPTDNHKPNANNRTKFKIKTFGGEVSQKTLLGIK